MALDSLLSGRAVVHSALWQQHHSRCRCLQKVGRTPMHAPHRQALTPHTPLLDAVQDGQAITPSERIAARQALPSLQQQLHGELAAEGVDVQAAAGVEDDGDVQEGEVAETGYVDEQGELRRPWCPQTRILEHREMVRSCMTREVQAVAGSECCQQHLCTQGGSAHAAVAAAQLDSCVA